MGIFREFKLENILIIAGIAVAGLQAISFLLTQIFNFPLLKTGPIFLVLALVIGILIGFAIVAKGIRGQKWEKLDFLIFGVALVIAAVFIFYVPKLVPSIFSSASLELQSMIGLGT